MSRFYALPLSLVCLIGALQTPTFANAEDVTKEVRNGELSAEDLADFLGVGAWVFEYDGGRPRCRLEIEEEGQKTVSKKEVLVVTDAEEGAGRGKILFFLRPSDIQVRINSATTRGGAGVSLPEDALWWGWSGFSAETTRLEAPLAPEPGEDVVLLRYEAQEAEQGADDPSKLRKVVLKLILTMDAE